MSNRTIIVVWWWSSGSLDTAYDEWQVSNSSDSLVRIDTPYSPKALKLLDEVLSGAPTTQEVLVFLHRTHGYNDTAMQQIGQLPGAKRVKILKSFLFGEGSDPVYLANNPRGLLGTKGTFVATFSSGKQIDAREKKETKIIKKEHFDHVWNFYANSFKQRIFEFSEDLYLGLTPLTGNDPIEKGAPYELLKKSGNEILLLRLLSFVGKIRNNSKPEMDLRKQEIIDKRTYHFSNLSQNLSNQYPVAVTAAYVDICNTIKSAILSSRQHLDLVTLRNQLSSFLKDL